MIIKEINIKRNFFSRRTFFIFVTDNKTIIKELNLHFDKDLAGYIKYNLKGLEVNSLEDVIYFSNKIPHCSADLLIFIQTSILSCFNFPWQLINKDLDQIPRILFPIFKKSFGIKEFYVFSLNCNDLALAHKTFKDILSSFDLAYKGDADEVILDVLHDVVKNVNKDLDFSVRIGVKFSNYESEKYVYGKARDIKLNVDEQFEYVVNLVEKYNLSYIEDVFYESLFEDYTKITEKLKGRCLVSFNSKINSFEKGLEIDAFNCVLLSLDSLSNLKTNLSLLSSKKIPPIIFVKDNLVDLVSGLKIPLIKFDLVDSDKIVKRILGIQDEIKSKKIKQDIENYTEKESVNTSVEEIVIDPIGEVEGQDVEYKASDEKKSKQKLFK